VINDLSPSLRGYLTQCLSWKSAISLSIGCFSLADLFLVIPEEYPHTRVYPGIRPKIDTRVHTRTGYSTRVYRVPAIPVSFLRRIQHKSSIFFTNITTSQSPRMGRRRRKKRSLCLSCKNEISRVSSKGVEI
jgi:hypothetical protein